MEIKLSKLVQVLKLLLQNYQTETLKSPLWTYKEHSNQLDEEEFEIIKDWQLKVCEKKEMLGLSTHILTITKKT